MIWHILGPCGDAQPCAMQVSICKPCLSIPAVLVKQHTSALALTVRRLFPLFHAGMHASVTSHLVNDYLLDETTGRWGQNLAAFQERLGNEGVKNRTENLYFAFLFVLRAVMKAGPYLEGVDYQTGLPAEDANTFKLVQSLVRVLRAMQNQSLSILRLDFPPKHRCTQNPGEFPVFLHEIKGHWSE